MATVIDNSLFYFKRYLDPDEGDHKAVDNHVVCGCMAAAGGLN